MKTVGTASHPFRDSIRGKCFPRNFVPVRSLLTLLALFVFGPISLQAEDVIVTATVDADGTLNSCPPSCCTNLGTTTTTAYYSTAIPAGNAPAPRKSRYAKSELATWTVTPTLGTSSGAYKVYVSKGTSEQCPLNILVKIVATSGCDLYDTNGVPAPSGVLTSAFQQYASINVWTAVAIITNSSVTPTITFSWASGGCERWYIDEVRFETLGATPARITQILHGNPVTIAGNGPVNHPFALVSSTNVAQPLHLWTAEQTNTNTTGVFTFSVAPGTPKARFFRVITQ